MEERHAVEERSDEEIAVAVARVLEFSSTAPAGVTVEVEAGIVTLRGRAPSELAKFCATLGVQWVVGVRAVLNEIEVGARGRAL